MGVSVDGRGGWVGIEDGTEMGVGGRWAIGDLGAEGVDVGGSRIFG